MTSRLLSALALLCLSSSASAAKPVIVGKTFPIAEPDAMQELKQKAASINWREMLKRSAVGGFAAFESLTLPRAQKDGSRLFDPTYELPYEIRDENGKVRYPAGFKVNPYEKLYFPGRYIFITSSPEDLRWLDTVVKPDDRDKVFLANGNPVLFRQKTGRKVFLFDDRVRQRFGVEHVPCIVQQEGIALRVTDYAIP